MQARYYDPVIGRFYSNDPVGFTGEVDTFNRYSYVANNPYRYTDPTGETKENKMAPLAKAVGEAIFGKKFSDKMGAMQTLSSQSASPKQLEKALKSVQETRANIKKQATDLVKENGNKNRVTMRSPSQKVEIDLDGKAHNGVPTPHTKTSTRNLKAPNQPAYNTKGADTTPTTQQEIRAARKFLEKENKS